MGSCVIVPWSHERRSVTCVPTASTRTGRGQVGAASAADTTSAIAPSHGTSQSKRPNGVLIIRASR